MAAEPTTWTEVSTTSNGWYQETPEFALYNTDKSYNADLPYDLDVEVKATDWDTLTATATSWSEV